MTRSQHSPVTFHLIAQFLDVAKPTARVALLLIGMIAIARHVTSFATGVAQLLPLFFGLLAIPGNVATPVAVVARCAEKNNILLISKDSIINKQSYCTILIIDIMSYFCSHIVSKHFTPAK